jgi:hypothetical protein
MTEDFASTYHAATQTATGNFYYAERINGRQLRDWVQAVHTKLGVCYGWEPEVLKEGSFGFDILAEQLGNSLLSVLAGQEVSTVAELVQTGWKTSYRYWGDNSPWARLFGGYEEPFVPLGGKNREARSIQTYGELDPANKDRVDAIVRFMFEVKQEMEAQGVKEM